MYTFCMASVYQRGDGRWVVATSSGGRGNRVFKYRYAASHEDAERIAHEIDPSRGDPWKGVDRSGECWVWLGATNGKGYGIITDGPRRRMAHRVIYEREVGPIPKGHYLCHHCDNPPCVRPSHLFPGTQSDNMRDMVAKGRHSPRHSQNLNESGRNPIPAASS